MTESSTRNLIDDLRAVVAEAEALIEAGIDAAGARAGEARERAAQSVGTARRRLEEIERDVAARAQEATEDAARYVRDHPLQALGIAAAVGIVIGLMLGRRES